MTHDQLGAPPSKNPNCSPAALGESVPRSSGVFSQGSILNLYRLLREFDELSRRGTVKTLMVVVLMGASWIVGGPTAGAQNAPPQEGTTHVIKDQDLKLLRQDLRSKRKQLIAANLKLTETEATKFWPVYDQYVTELIAINDKKFGLIQEYADNWGKMTNEQSLLFTRNWLDMDIAIAQLRQKYVPMVAKVLDGIKTATFFQLDRRIAMMMDLQVSSQMPLVQEQESSSKSAN
jgi:hypothetical protein